MTRPVKLRIDRLVLNGSAAKDRAALVSALQAELKAQLTDLELGGGHKITKASAMAPYSSDVRQTGRNAAAIVARQVKGRGS